MRKIHIFLAILSIAIISCKENVVDIEQIDNNTVDTEIVIDDNNLPECIMGLKKGISVVHDPDTIYAEINEKDSSRYIWKHSTVIKTEIDGLKITEFGTYNFKEGKWVLGNKTQKPYTTSDFEKWYFIKTNDDIISWENCKEGILKANVEYIDPSSWSVVNKDLVERHGLWYYIGIDTMGEKYMGYGTYITVPELKPL